MRSQYHGAAAPPMLPLSAVAQAEPPADRHLGFAPYEVSQLLRSLAGTATLGLSDTAEPGPADAHAAGTAVIAQEREQGPAPAAGQLIAARSGAVPARAHHVLLPGQPGPAAPELGEPDDDLAFSTALAAARTATDLARMLSERLSRDGSPAVFLAVLDADGTLRLSGQADEHRAAGAHWSRAPLHCALPLARMATGEQSLWLDGDDGDRVLTWVSCSRQSGARTSRERARALARSVVCVVGVAWPSASAPAPPDREHCARLTARVGRRLRDLASMGLPGDDLNTPWIDAVLEAIPVPAALLLPVRDRDGAVVEFFVDRCNERATDLRGSGPEQIAGGRLLAAFPGLGAAGVLSEYVRVLESGEPFSRGPFTYEEPCEGVLYPALISVQAQRLGGGLLASWQFHDEQARSAARIADAERLMNLAWAEWNLVTGEVAWTRGMYAILGLSRESAPLGLHELSLRVVEDDLPSIARMAEAFCERRAAVTFECRLKRLGPPRHVNVTAEPVLNTLGNLVALRCVVQDVTARRTVEAALLESRQQVETHRRQVVEEMQRALLAEYRPRLPGLQVAVRYLSAEQGVQVGGDWFDATTLPDRRVLICIGDASGHGLQAAARMAQLRNALLGIAHTGASPTRMLDCLNVVAYHSQGETAIATAIAAVFDPVRRSLSWARAGHPAPVLVRGGRAWPLADPGGTALGVAADPDYVQSTVPLRPGDNVILYTDGLLERRLVSNDERLELLLATAAQSSGAQPEQMLETLFGVLDADPEDDRCVIVLRVEGADEDG